jgi:4-alpha-glucanotransferase
MDADPALPAHPDSAPVIVARTGVAQKIQGSGTIVLEDGRSVSFNGRLPNLPSGYHELQLDGTDRKIRVIASPGKCCLPEHLKTWGWAVQLYAARSHRSWGIGDFGDLQRLAKWSADELSAGMMLLNPLSAATPIKPQQPSPYYPTSRRFFNSLAIDVEWAARLAGINASVVSDLVPLGRELNAQRLIDRDKVFNLKMEALGRLWERFGENGEFDEYCSEHGLDLDRFATFCALAEHHQSGWHAWPEDYRHPDAPAVSRFAEEHKRRVQFHKWLQWLLDCQLRSCSGHLSLMQDLPIGVDPDGADAWAWQDVLAKEVGVGAPPDEFNTQGQNWGLPPFVPWKLRAAGYEPFIQTIRAAFRNGGGLRIDHVMGLFRLFWIPNGMRAADGAYVRYNADEMLSIVALESERNQAYVVGEDLGTIEKGAREKLAEYGVLSYRLLWFEKDAPERYPKEALAAVTTHDLPTVAGLWTGADLKRQQELNLNPNEKSTNEIRDRLATSAELKPDASLNEVVEGAYKLLARAPSRIVTASLDDSEMVEDRPNMPATMGDQNPNWSLALPRPIEDLMKAELPRKIASILEDRESSSSEAVASVRR